MFLLGPLSYVKNTIAFYTFAKRSILQESGSGRNTICKCYAVTLLSGLQSLNQFYMGCMRLHVPKAGPSARETFGFLPSGTFLVMGLTQVLLWHVTPLIQGCVWSTTGRHLGDILVHLRPLCLQARMGQTVLCLPSTLPWLNPYSCLLLTLLPRCDQHLGASLLSQHRDSSKTSVHGPNMWHFPVSDLSHIDAI